MHDKKYAPAVPAREKECLSCGAALSSRKRRYCAAGCRDDLLHKLDLSRNLLRAMRARYATFSFTPAVLLFNVIMPSSSEVFTFVWQRRQSKKPAKDLYALALELGRRWHGFGGVCSRSTSVRRVLRVAETGVDPVEWNVPRQRVVPKVNGKLLSTLNLSKEDLKGPDAEARIKKAFRKLCLQAHPDQGGSEREFIAIRSCRDELLQWLQNPRFSMVHGLPDKWSYDALAGVWKVPSR
ncbi:MAG: hypothetical protein ACOC15_02635 [Desulfovibrionales bacterium]